VKHHSQGRKLDAAGFRGGGLVEQLAVNGQELTKLGQLDLDLVAQAIRHGRVVSTAEDAG
jgi:hypothetical protein